MTRQAMTIFQITCNWIQTSIVITPPYVITFQYPISGDRPLNPVSFPRALTFGNFYLKYWSKKESSQFQSYFEEIPCSTILNIWKHVLLVQYLPKFTILAYWLRCWFLSPEYLTMRFTGIDTCFFLLCWFWCLRYWL